MNGSVRRMREALDDYQAGRIDDVTLHGVTLAAIEEFVGAVTAAKARLSGVRQQPGVPSEADFEAFERSLGL